MMPKTDPPTNPAAEHEAAAFAYLRAELGSDSPTSMTHQATFPGAPLEGEGDMSVFGFSASIGGEPEQDYRVVAGQTSPNYYPSWKLDTEEAFELHLGTRFMLVMEVATVPSTALPPNWMERITEFIHSVAPGEPIADVVPAVVFKVGDELHLVSRAKIADEEVYVLGLDCPPGVYRKIDLPPHVIFRLHVGMLIRREARDEVNTERKNC